jgi:hypothetical protein
MTLAWSLLGAAQVMAIEEPSYEVIDRIGEVEIRAYAPQIVAETEVEGELDRASNVAFRRLARYIFGGNRARGGGSDEIAMTAPVGMRPAASGEGERIAMTAPVGMAVAGERWRMTFAMPRSWTLDTLPEPLDAEVRLRAVPVREMAVLRFSGLWSDERFADRESALRSALAASNWRPAGDVESMRYDPPWKPWFLRRNEVQIPVVRGD